MRDVDTTDTWTADDDAFLRGALLSLRADVDASPLTDPEGARSTGDGSRRRRMLGLTAGVAAAVAIVAALGFRGLVDNDALPPPQPATPTPTLPTGTPTTTPTAPRPTVSPTSTSTPTTRSSPRPTGSGTTAATSRPTTTKSTPTVPTSPPVVVLPSPSTVPPGPWVDLDVAEVTSIGGEGISARRGAQSATTLEYRKGLPDTVSEPQYTVAIEGPTSWTQGDGGGYNVFYGVTPTKPSGVRVEGAEAYDYGFVTQAIGDGLTAVVVIFSDLPDDGSVTFSTVTWTDASGAEHAQPLG